MPIKVLEYDNLILGEKIFGLEIVNNTVRVLELKRSGGRYSVVGFGQHVVGPKSISNGVIVEREAVAEAIEKAREEARPRKIRNRYASVVLPDSKIFIRVIKFPAGMTKEEIRESVEWKAKDFIAMPLEKVYWDWHRLTPEENSEGKEVEVVVSAVEKECADSYTKTLELLNIKPLYYDISGNAAARFLFQKEYSQKKALLVRIDKSSTTLSLFLDGGVRYQTIIKDVIRGGYGALVDFASSQLKVDPENAEKLILSPANLNDEQKALLTEFFDAKFDHLIKEIDQILDYYRQTLVSTKKKEKRVGEQQLEIYLYGKGARVYHIVEFFEAKSVKVSTDVKSTTSVSPIVQFISRQSLLESLVLLGLSLRNLGLFRELRDINLVPKSIKIKYIEVTIYSSLYSLLRMIFWNVFIIGVILAMSSLITEIYKSNVKEELKAVENVAESRANKQLREDIVYVNNTAAKIDLLFSTQTDWDQFFKEISSLRGSGITYDSILVTEEPDVWKTISKEKQVLKKEGFNYLVINGIAETRDDLQRYVLSMEASDIFEDINMPISSYEASTNIDFTLYCLLNINKLKE